MGIYLGSWVTGAAATGIAAVVLLFAVAIPAFGVEIYASTLPAAIVTLLLGAACLASLGVAVASAGQERRSGDAGRAAHVPADLVHLGHLVPARRRAGLAREGLALLPALAHRQRVRQLLRAGGERQRSSTATTCSRSRSGPRSACSSRCGASAGSRSLCGGMWFKSAVVYQIYPRSFADSDGDGIGDLGGIAAHLDHLAELGRRRDLAVAGLPLAAGRRGLRHQRLPGHRAGLRDARAVRRAARGRARARHEADHGPGRQPHVRRAPVVRRVALLEGLAPSATGTGGGTRSPNDWRSFFSGPAWELDEATGEYYLHLFSRKQPDLNWENPEVRAAIYAMMRWWLDRGVDGFRMDVINLISKPAGLPDGDSFALNSSRPAAPRVPAGDAPRGVRRPRRGLLTVGEMPGVTVEEARLFTDPARAEVDMVFQFEHVQLDQGPTSKWDMHPLRLTRPQGVARALAGRRSPTSAGTASTGTTTTSRGRSRASATTASTASPRRRCSARSCTCTAGRRTSTRARSSG